MTICQAQLQLSEKQIAIHEKYMREALKEARKASKSGNWPIGAVIVVDDVIVARAGNQVYSDVDKTHHAELLAIQHAATILHTQGRRAILYTTYEPCTMCLGAALINHIGTIVSGPDLDESGSLCLVDHLPAKYKLERYQFELIRGILDEECIELGLQGIPTHKLSSQYRKLQHSAKQ